MNASVDRHSDADGMTSEGCSRSAQFVDAAVQSHWRIG